MLQSQDQFDLHVHVNGLHEKIGDDEIHKNEAHRHNGHWGQEIILWRWCVGQDDHEQDEGEDDDREECIVDAQENKCLTIHNLQHQSVR